MMPIPTAAKPPMAPPDDGSSGGTDYPGVHFQPPPGTIDPDAMEGEAIVQWRKVGGDYTFISLDGKPLNAPSGPPSKPPEMPGSMSADEEIDSMAYGKSTPAM